MNFDSLTIDSLYYSYNNNAILKGIFAQWNKNEIVGIIGSNGCGKSTFFNTVTVFNNFDGSLFINDKLINNKKIKNYIAYLPQTKFLPKNLKVKHIMKLYKLNREPNIYNDCKYNQVANNKIYTLSSGEQRYIEFLVINYIRRPIVILDEPLTEIDPILEQTMFWHINEKKMNRLYIIADHKHQLIDTICSKVYQLKNGRLSEIVTNIIQNN